MHVDVSGRSARRDASWREQGCRVASYTAGRRNELYIRNNTTRPWNIRLDDNNNAVTCIIKSRKLGIPGDQDLFSPGRRIIICNADNYENNNKGKSCVGWIMRGIRAEAAPSDPRSNGSSICQTRSYRALISTRLSHFNTNIWPHIDRIEDLNDCLFHCILHLPLSSPASQKAPE